jgi:O-antigen ligase
MRYKSEVRDYDSVFPPKTSRPRTREEQALGLTPPTLNGERLPDGPDGLNSGVTVAGAAGTKSSMVAEEHWLRRHGHSMSFVCLFAFSVVLYFRPYELFPALSSFTSMAFYTGLVTLIVYAGSQLVLEGNLTARPKEVNLALLLGLAAILSIPLAIDPAEAWGKFGDLLIKTILIFIVIVNVVRTELRLKLLIWLVLCVSIYLSINVIRDYQSGVFQLGTAETNTLRVAGSIRGLFDNSNDLALHLVTIIPIITAMALEKRGSMRKVVYLSSALLMVTAVIFTFSRGAFIALIATSFLLVWKLGRRNSAAAMGAIILGIVFFLAVAPGSYSGRLATIFNSASDITGSSSQRTQVLKRSIVVALRYPLFGVGIGNFHHRSIHELETHNAYTQVASEMGIAAMVVYIMFLVHPLKKLRKIERELYERKDYSRFYYLAIGLQGSLVAFMVASFFAAVAYQWYIYYLVGYAIALRRIYYLQEAQSGTPPLLETPASIQPSGIANGFP